MTGKEIQLAHQAIEQARRMQNWDRSLSQLQCLGSPWPPNMGQCTAQTSQEDGLRALHAGSGSMIRAESIRAPLLQSAASAKIETPKSRGDAVEKVLVGVITTVVSAALALALQIAFGV